MRLENDKNFTFLYDEEFAKIPFIFRFTKRRYMTVLIVMGVLILSVFVLTTVFYNTAETVVFDTAIGYESLPVNTYDNRFLVALIICAVIVAVMAGWMLISRWFERRAFRKATELSNMIFLSERHRAEIEWQNWKMENRDY